MSNNMAYLGRGRSRGREIVKLRNVWVMRSSILLGAIVLTIVARAYVQANPLVFNESLWEHAHCMVAATLTLRQYAEEHRGQFPYHTNGYGDALLAMTPDPRSFYFLTGPGYGTSAFDDAFASGGDVDERRCGRVYVQGLTRENDPRIALLLDKVAAPPDHCHFPERLWRGFVRDVAFVDGSHRIVSVKKWPDFTREQVDLLVKAGFSRKDAQSLYDQAK